MLLQSVIIMKQKVQGLQGLMAVTSLQSHPQKSHLTKAIFQDQVQMKSFQRDYLLQRLQIEFMMPADLLLFLIHFHITDMASSAMLTRILLSMVWKPKMQGTFSDTQTSRQKLWHTIKDLQPQVPVTPISLNQLEMHSLK